MINAECPANLACINERCKDPCIGVCGRFTTCSVLNHNSMCHCVAGYTGDPFTGCTEIIRSKSIYLNGCDTWYENNWSKSV